MPFPCQNGGMGVEMRVLVLISPILLLSERFRVKPYPSKQKKGVEGLPLKDLVRGPVCWATINFYLIPFRNRAVIMRRHLLWLHGDRRIGIFGRPLFDAD